MTLPTYQTARDEIFGLFKARWDALAPALNGGQVPRVEWQGRDPLSPPPPDQPFARVFVRHSASRQATFGATGQRRFTRVGVLTVQVYTPIAKTGGLSLAENLGIIARDAYEGVGTNSGICFRNVSLREVGPAGAHYMFSLVADFEYDEIR